ncbi:hypothetical protein GALL_199350 [mine drainage metagenome]|uniref:Uncharacterized protein n=1 Tax=mine drainage metagenome TaxID=410659 RepID=A0A1J5RPR6_9ZZZZ
MPTFAELYCSRHGCPLRAFRRRIFWQLLPWHALPLAPVLVLGDYFAPDYSLIDACARATGMGGIYEAIRDYPNSCRNLGWLRRRARVRISTRRLYRLAAIHLGDGNLPVLKNRKVPKLHQSRSI